MIFNPVVVRTTGRKIALLPPSDFAASPGNQQVSLTWTDPGDETSGGVVVAEWEFTRIVRKVGSPPVNETDGVIVTESTVKNQYLSTPYVDSGLVNGTTYYYGAFACSKAGAWSDGAFAGAIPVAGTPLGDLTEGTLIKIKENGTPVEFYVAKQGYEPTLNGPNRVLMVRKDVYDKPTWSNTSNAWESSSIRSLLNTSYKGLFSGSVQEMMATTNYRYTVGNGNAGLTTGTDSVFLLSLTELGKSYNNVNTEGTSLPNPEYLQIAYFNGSPEFQWTRSPIADDNIYVILLIKTGDVSFATVFHSGYYGSRPVFTLPASALVDPDLNLIESSDIPPIETPLGDLVEGTLITIQEMGVPTEYFVTGQTSTQTVCEKNNPASPVRVVLPSSAKVDANLALIEEV